MTRRHYTSQGTSHIVHPGYRYQSNPHARFERPAGEPPLWLGVLLLAAIIGAAVLAIVAFSPGSSSVNTHTEAKSASAIEVGTRRDSQP